ncbi:GAF and ANTAR domain-containing protein [Arthrobacter sp. SX1312]|uniref:GAF and ANTAR domain-containing protein n=1 Tax=Arthrobacter sp. SX1312 TaxID=2058896 RepID=UPI002157B1BD|nr:GAF and ANTAR domain-containing protein [Arthrobacter sp. SX1312]
MTASVAPSAAPSAAPAAVDRPVLAEHEFDDLFEDEYEQFLPGTPAHTAIYLQDLVLDSTDVESFLDSLARAATEHLAGHDVFCGVTLLRPRTNVTIASSSPEARRLDELQYSYGDGPCLTAARTDQPVHVPDTRTDQRWPEYLAQVTRHGASSILGVPIPLDGEAKCGLNLYSTASNTFTAEARHAAGFFAREASRSLRLAVRIATLAEKTGHLNAALQSRTVIDLAAGIIMAQNKCSQTAAVAIMKSASSHRQVKLRDLAHELVVTINHQGPDTHFD